MVGKGHFEQLPQLQGHGIPHQRAVDIVGNQGVALGFGQTANGNLLVEFQPIGFLHIVPGAVAPPLDRDGRRFQIVDYTVAVDTDQSIEVELLVIEFAQVGIVGYRDVHGGNIRAHGTAVYIGESYRQAVLFRVDNEAVERIVAIGEAMCHLGNLRSLYRIEIGIVVVYVKPRVSLLAVYPKRQQQEKEEYFFHVFLFELLVWILLFITLYREDYPRGATIILRDTWP